ncbi:hypothetical protein BO99DRAFT_375639 [Aspergillus violaceofuscus CBS 115571]|uniref:Vacuolar protein sorting protein 62 n=1 Tax=Aspergillus violaceofuscus (strain CBS 115571) TaxID=1450538 RepID=A0A2V5HG75_ASPV1|nr:hypothetical protein BO99DRAFT_375639 [Aspergillus violaceofuscus CBS 115571]
MAFYHHHHHRHQDSRSSMSPLLPWRPARGLVTRSDYCFSSSTLLCLLLLLSSSSLLCASSPLRTHDLSSPVDPLDAFALIAEPDPSSTTSATFSNGQLVTHPSSTTAHRDSENQVCDQDKVRSVALSAQSHSQPADPAVSASVGQQMVRATTAAILTLSSLIAYVVINSVARAVNPSAFIWYEEDQDERRWISSSPSWLDRKACRWFGLCGTAHFRLVRPRFGHRKAVAAAGQGSNEDFSAWRAAQFNDSAHPEAAWDEAERSRREIPDYVFQYAPLVHLFSDEQFWPCDIAEHLYHITPMLNYTPVQSYWNHPTLHDLDQLNQWQDGHNVFLTSNDNVEHRPSWMEGDKNIPDDPDSDLEKSWPDWDARVDGPIPNDTPGDRAQWYDSAHALREGDNLDGGDNDAEWSPEKLGYLRPEDLQQDEGLRDELRKRFGGEPIHVETTGGRSNAPAILLVMDKGNGIVDAFWFFFYSFNLGNVVLNVRFGNHVGDWEHCLVRFHNGRPKALFFSAHSAGEAYSYEAVEKIGQRPVIYSALGTHAMYATPGVHAYILPWGLLHDQTNRGPLWDPLLNVHTYTYDFPNDMLRASTVSPSAPIEWFYFNGHWGDKFYPLGDERQYRFAGQYHYVNGPLGPRFKHLNRRKVCQQSDDSPCVIKNYIGEQARPRRWASAGAKNPGEHPRN